MTELIEKARIGRMSALTVMASTSVRVDDEDCRKTITFISSRARSQATAAVI